VAKRVQNRPVQGGAAIFGVNETLRALSKLGKDARAATKDKVQKIANYAAQQTRMAAPRDPRYAALGQNAKAIRDRVPVVEYGGAKKAGVSGGATLTQLVYGMEFGAYQEGRNGWRFPPRTPRQGRGNQGYWIFPTASRIQPDIAKLWLDALDEIAEEWGRG
jgi:hypothetical protein